ncbi:amino acid adenylation domain-containing protein [Sorangium sp. So ce233]|uniref:amino acid adenylation domain-containing protein n=1 Tax=Sorangium sp. So ce233 TaxID=3133290 RepID=UPI003F5F1E96
MHEEIASSDLRDTVANMLGVMAETVREDSNLIELGMDSITMMRLAGRWRRQGIEIDFAELLANPRVSAWRALIGERSCSKGERDERSPAATTIDEAAPFELALMQHAYWIGRQQGQQLGDVAAHFYNEFDGEGVEPARLESAIRKLIERHGMLRVQILSDGRQQILSDGRWRGLEVHDLRALSADAAQRALAELRRTLSHRRMDLAAGEVFDIQISLLPDAIRAGGTRLHVNLDMVAADALSLRVLLADLAHLYVGSQPLPPINYSYPRYLAERDASRASVKGVRSRTADREYWQARLSELPAAPQLPAAPYHANVGATTVVRRHRWLAPEQVRAFASLAARHGLTPAMAMAAVFAEMLNAWSAEPRFLMNLPMFGREPLHPDVGMLVGDFTSSVLLAWDGAAPGSFAERALRLQAQFHADAEHVGYSGVEVLRDLSRLRGEQVLAPVVYTSALGLGELFPEAVKQRFGRPSWIISQGPQVWLDAQVTEFDGGLLVNLDAREDAFAPGVLDAMFDAHGRLLERLLADEEAWRQPVPPLLPADQMKVRAAVNATSTPTSGQRLHDGFFELAKRQPDAPALLWGTGDQISYGELAERALRLSAALVQQGVARGDVVAVNLPKGPDQIAAVLGVLAAGAAYLPVGVDQPDARRDRMLGQAGVRVVVTGSEPRRWPDSVRPCVFEQAMACAPAPRPTAVDVEQLAYIIFTSGSTGEPKGVEITHRAALNTVLDINQRFGVGADDRVLAVSALDFDLSVYDIFGLLSAGGSLVLIEEESRRDARRWHELVRRHEVTIWNSVPTLLDMLLIVGSAEEPPGALRLALVSGDWIRTDLPGRLAAQRPGCRFIALGGATEASIWSNFFEVDVVQPAWRSIPYGYPLRNQLFRVVDAHGRDCPDWVPGELWIGGLGVARGYCAAPDLTARKFVADGERWYRTGDVGRYWPDGTLEFLGRTDKQVKIRGHRIELGEIEAAVGSYPGVGQAAAVLGDRGLFVVVTSDDPMIELPEAGELIDLRQPPPGFAALREFLADRLPAAMMPDHLWRCRSFPLTPNGKIDRKALQRAVNTLALQARATVTAPVGEVERRVAGVWAELLKLSEVGREDNFFAAGGDSLLATRLVRRLREVGLAGVKLAELFAHPTLADFAATLRLGESVPTLPTLVADPANRHQPFPPTEVQRAYWLGRDESFTLGGVGCQFYREYDVVDLDVPRLEAAVNVLIRRHEMLRAVFDEQGQQRILAEVPRFTVEVVDGGEEPAQAYEELRRDCSHRVFDPTRWPLFAMRAVRSGNRTRLGVSLDNLILDALSILTFYSELTTLYETPDASLPPVGLSFRDYVLTCTPGSDALDAARTYWAERLPELPPAPQLPLARDPGEVGRPRFTRHEGSVDAARWRRLVERAGEHGITPSTILLTAFAEVLSRWCSRPDLTLNLTLFDRREVHPDIHRVMGDFTSLTLIGYRPVPGESWATRARRVQQEVGDALDHRDVSSISLVRELGRLSGAPSLTMPVVFTSALGVPGGTAAPASGPFRKQVWGLTQTPQVWLDHQVIEAEGGIALNWDVVEDLFPEGFIATMFDAYLRELSWLSSSEWTLPVPDLMPEQQRRVRARVNATEGECPRQSLHGAFFGLALAQPQRVALRWGEADVMSYGELAERALRLSAALVQQGVARGDVVAVNLPKGPDQIAAVLGVLAAGAAYLPVGVDQPDARRDRMLGQAGVRVVVTGSEPRRWPDSVRPCVFEQAMACAPAPRPTAVDVEQLAYIIFTSGSTGEPKGVEITHRAALNTVLDINQRFGVGADDRVLAVSALDFDLSVYDIFGLLSAGGSLVLIEEESRRDARRWHELVRRHEVTIWNSVPTLLDMLLIVGSAEEPPGALRLALVSGDWIRTDLPGRLAAQRPGCRFIALGGATEASIWSNFFEVDVVQPAWRSIPYGYPLRNQLFRVVDAHGRDCPDWVPGELWIGGLGVARGYCAAPDLTARKFVADGERWYRTGDVGRYWPDGTLEFLGRTDKQVKIRGHRIELGEVEAALRSHPGVRHAVAVAVGGRLAAAVVPAAAEEARATMADGLDGQLPAAAAGLDAEQLRDHVAMSLPLHMVPERIEVLAQLPLSANGKVNHAEIIRLISAEADTDARDLEPPRGEWEHTVAALWRDLLAVANVGRHQSFFQLGGDSLLATRFIEAVNQRHAIMLPLRRLFNGPTLREVAAALAAEHEARQEIEEGVL